MIREIHDFIKELFTGVTVRFVLETFGITISVLLFVIGVMGIISFIK